ASSRGLRTRRRRPPAAPQPARSGVALAWNGGRTGGAACRVGAALSAAAAATYMSLMRFTDLVCATPHGIYCPPGDFYIDPTRPGARALVTHGHADHARRGHGAVLATPETLRIMAERYGEDFAGSRQEAVLGEVISLGDVEIAFHPAGHVLGSAQIARSEERRVGKEGAS